MRGVGFVMAGALALGLAGCVTKGVIAPSEASYIDRVEVVMEQPTGTVNLAEDIRVKMLAEASRYSVTGRRKVLKVFVKNMHLKNAALSLLGGDDNWISAHVVVMDENGSAQGGFDLQATDKHPATKAGGLIGVVVAAAQNPVDAERRVAQALAADTLERVYGSDRAFAAQSRPPAREIAAHYPRPYQELVAEASGLR